MSGPSMVTLRLAYKTPEWRVQLFQYISAVNYESCRMDSITLTNRRLRLKSLKRFLCSFHSGSTMSAASLYKDDIDHSLSVFLVSELSGGVH